MVEYYRAADLETRVRSITHSIGVVVGAFFAAVVVSSLVGGLLLVAGFEEFEMIGQTGAPLHVSVAAYIMQFTGFFAVAFGYLWWYSDRDLFDISVPSLRDLAWMLGGSVLLYVLLVSLSALLAAAGIETATNEVITQGRQNPVLFLYLIPITFLFVAPAEELIYRGIVQGLLRDAYGVVPGVVFATLLFGSSHIFALLSSDGGQISAVALVVVLGLVLATIYEHTENLAVPIVIHGIFNAVQFVLGYLAATGAVPSG
jgi:membrane protease YdiL (CAAX protease family)